MLPNIFFFLFFSGLLLLQGAVARDSKWQTLSGNAPLIIARGGYSGIFPDYTSAAYLFAQAMSMPNVVFFCDLQLTQDGVGICRTDLRLDNSTNIADVFPDGGKTYNVNGESVHGWFSIDFTSDQILNNVTAIQNIYSRPNVFDGLYPVSALEDVTGLKPSLLWLNIQYDIFFKQHKQDFDVFVTDVAVHMPVNYISSPEVDFLKRISGKITKSKTKLIFKFLGEDVIEPTTKQTYGSFLKDLSTVKSFCSGILVPKTYIWPVDANQYLEPHTSLVQDAHKQGLEVYAYNFANDLPASYNYSYDPTAEYLQYIDNPDFSIDGVLTDFPSTASECVACLAHNSNSTTPKDKPLVITHNGASGVFAGCTDLAYQQAVKDGADIIDCSVQMTKDGIAFCLDSTDLMSSTTAVTTFMSRSSTISEIQSNSGIFSFDLTWSEIQSLKPDLQSPLQQASLPRNPAMKNQGKFMALTEFLDFAKDKSVNGILINIENAAYLASKRGLDIIGAVTTALKNSSFAEQTTQQVLIQSDDSAVLSRFKQASSYRRVLSIKETVSDAPQPTVEEIKQFADAVNIPRSSVISSTGGFLVSMTDVVAKMQVADISVYVSILRNEYMAIAFDFFADPLVEIATYVSQVGVDGVVTEFPATAAAYMRSPCYNYTSHGHYTILPVEPGSLVGMAAPGAAPPVEAPAPALTVANVVDPPLPPVSDLEGSALVAAPTSTHPSGQPSSVMINASMLLLMMVISMMFLS